jgi:hypothetical protein
MKSAFLTLGCLFSFSIYAASLETENKIRLSLNPDVQGAIQAALYVEEPDKEKKYKQQYENTLVRNEAGLSAFLTKTERLADKTHVSFNVVDTKGKPWANITTTIEPTVMAFAIKFNSDGFVQATKVCGMYLTCTSTKEQSLQWWGRSWNYLSPSSYVEMLPNEAQHLWQVACMWTSLKVQFPNGLTNDAPSVNSSATPSRSCSSSSSSSSSSNSSSSASQLSLPKKRKMNVRD